MKLKYTLLVLLTILFTSIRIVAQNITPIVSNSKFEQRTDGSFIVDIFYDLFDANNDSMTVSIRVSSDGGTTWNFTAENLSGDIGLGINSGIGKHIIWDFGTEHPETFSDNFIIEITADDSASEGNGTPCPGTPTITYEGKTYNTVLVGNQCWLKENLDVGIMIQSSFGGSLQTNNGIIEKYCYNNDESNCSNYGGFYEWNEAMQYLTQGGSQGICPSGWHIPTKVEFETLKSSVEQSSNALKVISVCCGSGTNTSGFSALLAGDRDGSNGGFYGLDNYTYFWSSTEDGNVNARIMGLSYNNDVVGLNVGDEIYGFSVRCTKD